MLHFCILFLLHIANYSEMQKLNLVTLKSINDNKIGQYQLGYQIIYTKDEWLILEKEITFDSIGTYGSRKT